MAPFTSSTVVDRLVTALKSMTDTLGVGTRMATPSSLPLSSGRTRPTALAAPAGQENEQGAPRGDQAAEGGGQPAGPGAARDQRGGQLAPGLDHPLALLHPAAQLEQGVVVDQVLDGGQQHRVLVVQVGPDPLGEHGELGRAGVPVCLGVGQLDGGHGTYAVFGPRAHSIIGRAAFITMAVLAGLGFLWYRSPSGFLFAVLLGIMMRVKHPQPAVMEPLGWKRTVVAILTLLVFVLCFWPFPITIS